RIRMATELDRDSVVRAAARPHWDRRCHRLKVQKGNRCLHPVERGPQTSFHHYPPAPNTPELTCRWTLSIEVPREVPQRVIAGSEKLLELIASEAIQGADVVRGPGRPTPRHERTLVRFRAMRPDADLRHRTGHHPGEGAKPLGNCLAVRIRPRR